MKVVMLAAGIGARLGFTGDEQSAISIDFAAEIERANTEILPRILSSIDNRGKTAIIKQTPDQAEKRIQ